jgi:phosphotransferase system HPr (HPr) family protein
MQNTTVTVINEVGLHARPAGLFVQEANKFDSDINVRNLNTKTEWVNAKSILSVLGLGVEQNHTIELSADGPDETHALEVLQALIQSNFADVSKKMS